MKKLIMNILHIGFVFLFLFILIIGIGCRKEAHNDYDHDSIFGIWKWIYSIGGDFTASYSYPKKGQTITMEFLLNDSLIFRENGKTYAKAIFSISEDTLNYFDDIREHIYLFRISGDTLELKNTFTLGDCSFYKRAN